MALNKGTNSIELTNGSPTRKQDAQRRENSMEKITLGTFLNATNIQYLAFEVDASNEIISKQEVAKEELELFAANRTDVLGVPSSKSDNSGSSGGDVVSGSWIPPIPMRKRSLPFSREVLEEALEPLKESHTFDQFVGFGTYGMVCKLTNKLDETKVAAKVVQVSDIPRQEVEIWKRVDHPNLLPLLDLLLSRKALVFVTPLMKTDLWKLVWNRKLAFDEIINYLRDALQGLDYMHSLGLCHLDIKSDNVLIGENGAQLCDFGFANYADSVIKISALGMTKYYRPPEACALSRGEDALVSQPKACDLWAFGVMTVEMLTDFPLTGAHSDSDTAYPVLHRDLQRERFFERVKYLNFGPDEISELERTRIAMAFDCVHCFLRYSPSKRMECGSALRHPLFGNATSFKRHPRDYMWNEGWG